MYKNKKSKKRIALIIIFLFIGLCFTSTVSAKNKQKSGGILWVRGGFGVIAKIDNFQLGDPCSNKSIDWYVTIEGDFVLFGTANGTIKPKAMGVARTALFPPAIGFGNVDITITVTEHGSSQLLAKEERNGFMIGPFILGMK